MKFQTISLSEIESVQKKQTFLDTETKQDTEFFQCQLRFCVPSFQVTLTSGEFLHAIVDQRGIDVVVAVFSPGGQKLAEIDSPNGTQGPEPINIEAKSSGAYRLEIRALEKDAVPGRYEVKIDELLSAEQYAERVEAKRNKLEAAKNWLASNAIPHLRHRSNHARSV
jgi:hypothetical protein